MAHGVTARELEILWYVAEHGSNRAAAELLGISEQTVKNMLSKLLIRTRSRSTLQAYHRLIGGRPIRLVTTHTYEEIE